MRLRVISKYLCALKDLLRFGSAFICICLILRNCLGFCVISSDFVQFFVYFERFLFVFAVASFSYSIVRMLNDFLIGK